MKNNIIKVSIIMFFIMIFLSTDVIAKYNYTYTLKAYNLKRDNSEIIYTIKRNDSEGYTNKDVLLTISLNKSIENVEGFELSEDRKTLTKLLKENEEKTIIVEDDYGNNKEISYNINNIDKIPPQIIGIESGKTYNTNLSLEYVDNIGIKDIFVDRYSSLSLGVHDDYYDTSFFKGIDLTDTTAMIRVSGHPKNTKTYKYYINNVLKSQTADTKYEFTGLNKGTSYTIKVEAIDENGIVLETTTRIIKTKLFSKVDAVKDASGSFTFTVHGIDSSIDNVIAVGFTNDNNRIYQYPSIKSNRSVSVNFSAQSITGNLQNGYYYFHLQLYDNQKGGVVDTVCCNIKFYENYVESVGKVDVYNLTSNGKYQIIVTDLAGNKTEKLITISK